MVTLRTLEEPPLRGALRGHRPGDRQHAARRAQALLAQARRAHLGQARVAQPDRVDQGPRRALDDRARRGRRGDPPGPGRSSSPRRATPASRSRSSAAARATRQGRHAGQRDARAHAAAAHVRGRHRVLAGREGLQRRRRDGARDGGGGLELLHALPVRQPGQPARPLQRHGARDPRGARRDVRLRGRPRDGRHADGQRPAPQGGAR